MRDNGIIRHSQKLLLCIVLLFTSYVGYSFKESSYAKDSLVDSVKLKVLSYNLRFGERASLEELAAFIKEQDPDVVALQEVDNRTFRPEVPEQNDKDFATELGYRTGMMPIYGKAISYAKGYYGIAILSKYPYAKVERIYLPKTKNGKEQRALLVADIEYKNGRYFTFASTHLDYTNTRERQNQVKTINEILSKKSTPVILAGDFNALPESAEIKEGMQSWERLSCLSPTFPTKDPDRLIDYIFSYPKDKWKKIKALEYKVNLSDHLPIATIVELKQK